MNTRENTWNACFATNQMRDEISQPDTKQQAGFLFHEKSSILPLTNTDIFLSLFRLRYHQRIDMNDILLKSNVESRRQDQTQLDRATENKKMSQSQAMLLTVCFT